MSMMDSIPPVLAGTSGRILLNALGDFMKNEIRTVYIPSGTVYRSGSPYTNKMKAVALSLPVSPTELTLYQKALNDPLSGVSRLIIALETAFETSQIAAAQQFNSDINQATGNPYVPVRATYVLPSGVFTSAIASSIGAAPINGIDIIIQDWVSRHYQSRGY